MAIHRLRNKRLPAQFRTIASNTKRTRANPTDAMIAWARCAIIIVATITMIMVRMLMTTRVRDDDDDED